MAQAGGLELLLEVFNVFGGLYLDDEIQITDTHLACPCPISTPFNFNCNSTTPSFSSSFRLFLLFCFWINTCLYNYILFYIVILLVSRINQI